MNKGIPPIYFYLPEKEALQSPKTTHDFWRWQTTTSGLSDLWGRYHWILQTYLYLKESGFLCFLVTQLPAEGILVTHRDYFYGIPRPKKKMIIVCLLADRRFLHPFAHYHIVHNPLQENMRLKRNYIPPWTQIGLIPREMSRGDLFENIAYYGLKEQLPPELNSSVFIDKLRDLGLNWHVPDPEHWNNFRDTDAIISVRAFKTSNRWLQKPALRLFNAWAAGAIPILGAESAYRAVGKNNRDYIEVDSFNALIYSLEKLKNDPELRTMLVKEGKIQYRKVAPEQTVQKWKDFLLKEAVPAYNEWRGSYLKRHMFFVSKTPHAIVQKIIRGVIKAYKIIFKREK